ncbi:MAG: D-alanyl-D-alanine carboxypeptidase [Desulfobacterales bacterium]|nr:D-alanyl-D-alanine carboxypeptidase [Desulfobacterales bacterium]
MKAFILILSFFLTNSTLYAYNDKNILSLVGSKDSLYVISNKGEVIFSKNTEKKLIPASTLKVLTSLLALHCLGNSFRFPTEFYIDVNSNLIMKGYGDPLLISETLKEIASNIASKIKKINNIILDDSYFIKPIIIPGVSSSLNPYDAPNSAISANFNTVYFKSFKGNITSAEEQTPIIPFVVKRIEETGLKEGRIPLKADDCSLYCGHLLLSFLKKENIPINGGVKIGKVRTEDKLIFKYLSKFPLEEVISKFLDSSNNFVANQLFLASGAKLFGEPASLDKGIRAAQKFAKEVIGIENLIIAEGSGISRENLISAKDMDKILKKFEPYHNLMRYDDREFYKTGTLTNVSTRVGYIENKQGQLYRFVLFTNTPGKSAKKILPYVMKYVN